MAFDESKDKILWEESVEGDRDTTLTVVVASYDGGATKIGLNRTKEDEEEVSFRKLGRMSSLEVRAILPLLQRATEEAGIPK